MITRLCSASLLFLSIYSTSIMAYVPPLEPPLPVITELYFFSPEDNSSFIVGEDIQVTIGWDNMTVGSKVTLQLIDSATNKVIYTDMTPASTQANGCWTYQAFVLPKAGDYVIKVTSNDPLIGSTFITTEGVNPPPK